MKRFVSLLCSVLLALSCVVFAPYVSAAGSEHSGELVLVSETVEYLDDGSMIVTSVYEESVTARSSLYTKTGSKIDRRINAEGEELWSFTVSGEFRVIEGASVTCTSASCSAAIYNDNWSCTRKSASPSGSQAVANGVFEMTVLGIAISRQDVEVTLSCDQYGNLS